MRRSIALRLDPWCCNGRGRPMVSLVPLAALAVASCLAGCSTLHSFTNEPLCAPPAPPLRAVDTPAAPAATPVAPAPAASLPTRVLATLDVDGGRGNPRVLVFLALSGGGSRSAYLSASTMLALQRAIPGADLLAEVDAISAVSGGALAGAHYASTRDAALWSPATVAQLTAAGPSAVPPAFRWSLQSAEIECTAPLDDAAREQLARVVADAAQRTRLNSLCEQNRRSELSLWSPRHVPERMARNYQGRWIGNWFWPTSIARYWTTSYDRADLMAQTLADNLFDSRILGRDLTLGFMNPERPFLILNATNASRWPGQATEMPFGSVFTFTREDFAEHLKSDIGSYGVARAVMGSSAFPVVFPAMTLADYRQTDCAAPERSEAAPSREPQHFAHVFDGGNSDNLGLKSIKRILLQQHADERGGRRSGAQRYDRIVVILVDAFTVPSGLARDRSDPRGWFDRILDLNVIQATDSLLQANRRSLIDEFADGKLTWTVRDCAPGTRDYPASLCSGLSALGPQGGELDLSDRLVFYHFGFADIQGVDPELKRRLDRIPTAFKIDSDAAKDLDHAVTLKINAQNRCLRQIADLVQTGDAARSEMRARVRAAREACSREDTLPPPQQRGVKAEG